MAIQAHSYITLNPSFMEPDLVLQYSQASGFVDALADKQLRTRIAEDDLLVYVRQINVRTKMAAQTASANELPSVDIQASMISTPTYLLQVGANWDHHDVAAGGRWGFAVPEAYRLGGRQANFQLARDAALFGMNPQNGEGLLNASGATAVNLPPDSFGNTTVVTYDNGQMAFYLAQQVLSIKTRTNQLGIGKKFTILGPQRTLGLFEYNVVQLVQFQRIGAGTTSTAGVLKDILMANADELIWAYDDTLIGAGAGGTDAVILVMPEVDKPAGDPPVNTNVFASLSPGNKVCTTQYCDMAAPREIVSPLAHGATDFLQEWRISSGWAVRPQALTIISMLYQ
jgi:Uncharacterized protein conserved in bacteria (DUF2184)